MQSAIEETSTEQQVAGSRCNWGPQWLRSTTITPDSEPDSGTSRSASPAAGCTVAIVTPDDFFDYSQACWAEVKPRGLCVFDWATQTPRSLPLVRRSARSQSGLRRTAAIVGAGNSPGQVQR